MLDRRSFLGIAAASAVAGIHPAFAATDEAALVAAAKKEAKGLLYTNTVPGPTQRLLDAFAAKYGIKFDIEKLTGAALAQRFTAEYASNLNLCDLFVSTDPGFPKDALAKGLLARADDLPALAPWPKASYQSGLVAVAYYPYVLAWNKEMVPGGLKGWEGLNDPAYRGKVLVGDPRVLASARNWYVAILEKYGEGFLKTLGSHATYSPSVVPGLQQLAAGAQAIYAPAIHLSVTDIIARGAPLDYALAEPVVLSEAVAGVAAKAAHPAAARLLLNFWMSAEGQKTYATGGYTLLPDIPGTKRLEHYADMDPSEGDKQLAKINALLGIG